MCPAALLGDRASGKTTFLGALYAAEVQYGTSRADTFRFFAPPDSLTLMSNIYKFMVNGSFPDATLKYEMDKVRFTFGFKTLVGKGMDFLKVRSDSRFLRPWKGVQFAAYDVSGEDVQEYITSGVASSPIIKQLLESYAVVILVDCSRMTLDTTSPSFRKMVNYDGEIAKLIVNFATYKTQEYERQKAAGKKPSRLRIFPAIVLTKTDQLSETLLHQIGLPPGIPSDYDSKERRDFCEELLRVFLPQTLSQLRGARVEAGGPSFDQAQVLCQLDPHGHRRRRHGPGGRPEDQVEAAGGGVRCPDGFLGQRGTSRSSSTSVGSPTTWRISRARTRTASTPPEGAA